MYLILMFLVPHTIFLYDYVNSSVQLLGSESVHEPYDSMTQQRTPPPLSLSEFAGLGDLLDDL